MLARQILNNLDLFELASAMYSLCEETGQIDRHSTPRRGGVIAVGVVNQDGEGITFVSTSFGEPGLKFGRYALNAAEKINRLFGRRQEGNDECAASMSADDTLGTFGGCIAFSEGILSECYISISGAPPEIDEALAFVIGERLGFKTPEYANEHIASARELLRGLILG